MVHERPIWHTDYKSVLKYIQVGALGNFKQHTSVKNKIYKMAAILSRC